MSSDSSDSESIESGGQPGRVGLSLAEASCVAKYSSLTMDQLRRQCEDARLSDAGSKEELVARLVDSADADSSKP